MSPHFVTAVALTLLASACGGSKDIQVKQAAEPTLPDSIFVQVTNDHYYDARIHAVFGGGGRLPLGTIHGNGGHAEVALAWQPRPITFVISFIIDGKSYASEPVDVARGDIVAVRLPPNIQASGFFRRVSQD